MFMQVCEGERERKKAILLRSSSPLCISDAPLSHDSHELSAAAAAAAVVSFSVAAQTRPCYLTHALLSVRAMNTSSNHLKMHYTLAL